MTERVTLMWADIRDPLTVTENERKPFARAALRAMWAEPNSEESFDALRGIAEAAIVVLVEDWSLPFPLPCEDPSVLGELDIRTYDLLAGACAEHINALEAPGTVKKPARKK